MPAVDQERIVIVGGGGFLGHKIISELQSNGFDGEIIVLDPFPRTFQTIKIDPTKVNFVAQSFRIPNVLDEVLSGSQTVYHLASIGHTGIVAGDRNAVFEFNVNGTKELVQKCQENGVCRFIYASSVAVAFIGAPLHNASEDDPMPDPDKYIDFYSASKAEAEKFVLSQSTENFKTTALRFRAIYGVEDPNVTQKVADLIRKGLFVGMVSTHGREAVSQASSGTNCAVAFRLAENVLRKEDGPHGRVYNIMDAETFGQYTFWHPLVMAFGKKPPVLFIPFAIMDFFVPHLQRLFAIFDRPPLLTKFELAILATDNTFSTARAEKELGYAPHPCEMEQVAQYFKAMEAALVPTRVHWKYNVTILLAFSAIVYLFFSLFN